MYYNFKKADRKAQLRWEVKQLFIAIAASAVVLAGVYVGTILLFCIGG